MIFIPLILFVAIQVTAGRAYEAKHHGEVAEQRLDRAYNPITNMPY